MEALESLDKYDLYIAILAGDESVIETLISLEAAYVAATGIVLNGPDIDSGVNLGDVSKIDILGAAFNSDYYEYGYEPVGLRITSAAPGLGFDPSAYSRALHLEIDLIVGTDGQPRIGQLYVPMQITMPLPPGFNASRVHILHYRSDGSAATIWPRDNGDGTISFALLSFSTFTFVELKDTSILYGDVNGDGVVNIFDIGPILNHVYGLEALEGDAFRTADMNNDGVVNIFDVGLILNIIYGIDN